MICSPLDYPGHLWLFILGMLCLLMLCQGLLYVLSYPLLLHYHALLLLWFVLFYPHLIFVIVHSNVCYPFFFCFALHISNMNLPFLDCNLVLSCSVLSCCLSLPVMFCVLWIVSKLYTKCLTFSTFSCLNLFFLLPLSPSLLCLLLFSFPLSFHFIPYPIHIHFISHFKLSKSIFLS